MAVKIRLKRVGAPHQVYFRVVAIESNRARDGKEIEILGQYNPRSNPPAVKLDLERVKHWISCGAILSPTVSQLVQKMEKTVSK